MREPYSHEKSPVTIILDVVRHLIVVATSLYCITVVWEWNWIIALLSAIPIYFVVLNVIGIVTFPLYLFTPEKRMLSKAGKAFYHGDFDKGRALTDEFKTRFNVNDPSDENSGSDEKA